MSTGSTIVPSALSLEARADYSAGFALTETSTRSTIVPSALSLEARAKLRKEQTLDLNQYLYDLNNKKQRSRPKRTVNTYEPKQKEFIVSLQIYISTDDF